MRKNINIISLLPEIVEASLKHGVVGQGLRSGLFSVNYINPRAYAQDQHKTVDDRPYGGGPGMLMMAEPLRLSIEAIKKRGSLGPVVLLSPQGQLWTNKKAKEFSEHKDLTFICGRYEGVDQRFIENHVTEEISIGNYVLTGGELACAVLVDSMARYYKSVLGNEDSYKLDSLENGLLKAPMFTRPNTLYGQEVPEVLKSGHHKNIEAWIYHMSLVKTWQKRPELVLSSENHGLALKRALKEIKKMPEDELISCGLNHKILQSLELKYGQLI